jgi:hypothetical protein
MLQIYSTNARSLRASSPLAGRLPAALKLLLLASVAGTLTNLLAIDYYVSPSGNDKRAGTSSAMWKTISRVNQNTYHPGDRILFQGGAQFNGTLNFSNASAGTAANPIAITSFGVGRATIYGGSNSAISAYNTAGFSISNLNLTGSGAGVDKQPGISFYADAAGNIQFDTVKINQVNVSGFKYGISIGSWNGLTGYKNVSITYVISHDNQEAGIAMYGYTSTTFVGYPHQNVYIGHSTAYNNLGAAGTTSSSGSGIVVGNANGVVIERSLAYNNGNNNTHNGGPVGIWTWDCANAVIQFNESHHNHTNSQVDGDGFDLDGGSVNCVMQYNYSHDNDGAGYAVAEFSGARPHLNNLIRYNISQNDSRRNGVGAITFWNGGSGIQNTQVFNNTVYVTPAAVQPSALLFETPTSAVGIRNNMFLTTGGVPIINVAPGQSGFVLQGNDYWSYGSGMVLYYDGIPYNSLAALQSATGQELQNGTSVGKNVDPMLLAPGQGGSLNNPDALSSMTAYCLQFGSPMIDSGLWLTNYGVAPGPVDYMNSNIYRGMAYDIGAIEF